MTWTVAARQTLQVAADDSYQVVEFFRAASVSSGDRFRGSSISMSPNTPLIHDGFAVSAKLRCSRYGRSALIKTALIGLIPIEPVGNCQKSGINQGCG